MTASPSEPSPQMVPFLSHVVVKYLWAKEERSRLSTIKNSSFHVKKKQMVTFREGWLGMNQKDFDFSSIIFLLNIK